MSWQTDLREKSALENVIAQINNKKFKVYVNLLKKSYGMRQCERNEVGDGTEQIGRLGE